MIQHCNSISLGLKGFLDGGFYIMRHDSFYMIVDCALADPKASSGHKHKREGKGQPLTLDKLFPAYIEERLRNATSEELDLYAELILDAKTIDDVFRSAK